MKAVLQRIRRQGCRSSWKEINLLPTRSQVAPPIINVVQFSSVTISEMVQRLG